MHFLLTHLILKHSTSAVGITSAGRVPMNLTWDYRRDGVKYLLWKEACGLTGMRNAILGKRRAFKKMG